MSTNPPIEEGARWLVATDILERFLWVAYGPDVRQVVSAIEESPAIRRTPLERPIPIATPWLRPRLDEEDDRGAIRGLAVSVSRALEFVDRVAADPDIVFEAAYGTLHAFAKLNLQAEHGWFADSDVTRALLSPATHVALRWTVVDEDDGDVSVRFLARSLDLNCESVLGALAGMNVEWRRSQNTAQAVWAEGTVGSRDVRFFAAADGTAELALRGGSLADALATVDQLAGALDQVTERVESIETLVSGMLQRL